MAVEKGDFRLPVPVESKPRTIAKMCNRWQQPQGEFRVPWTYTAATRPRGNFRANASNIKFSGFKLYTPVWKWTFMWTSATGGGINDKCPVSQLSSLLSDFIKVDHTVYRRNFWVKYNNQYTQEPQNVSQKGTRFRKKKLLATSLE